MSHEWIIITIQVVLFPLAIYAARVTRDRDMRELQQWVAQNFVSKEDFQTYQKAHAELTDQRAENLRGEIRALVQAYRRLADQLDEAIRRLDRHHR